VQELREDNTILMETKQMLEDQLSSSHKRVETVIELENEIMRYKQQLEETTAVSLYTCAPRSRGPIARIFVID
jgi:Lon protease-like protein